MTNLWKWTFRKLEWGETPWDDMPREQLVREVQRMYSALILARGPLINGKRREESSPYWRRGGVGGDAIDRVEQALSPYKNDESDGGGYEPAYRSFFRYAVDLLFDGHGSNWAVCENEHMIGAYFSDRPETCSLCRETGKGEVSMRPITWDDLQPKRNT
jgi:hypothetical protein